MKLWRHHIVTAASANPGRFLEHAVDCFPLPLVELLMRRTLIRVEYANMAIYVLMVFTFSAISHNHFRIAYTEYFYRDFTTTSTTRQTLFLNLEF